MAASASAIRLVEMGMGYVPSDGELRCDAGLERVNSPRKARWNRSIGLGGRFTHVGTTCCFFRFRSLRRIAAAVALSNLTGGGFGGVVRPMIRFSQCDSASWGRIERSPSAHGVQSPSEATQGLQTGGRTRSVMMDTLRIIGLKC